MCNPVRTAGDALPIAALFLNPPVDVSTATLTIGGTVEADAGLRASLSAIEGLRLHYEEQSRFVLRPQRAPDDLAGEAAQDFQPVSRLPGEGAADGLLRLLRDARPGIERHDSVRVLCTLILWAQQLACELDLRGGVTLRLDGAWEPVLNDSHCRWVTQLFARAMSDRVTLELRVGNLSPR